MSYGINAPQGLQAVRTQTDASWNGKTNAYPIASGYAQNIFKGDLVAIMNNGYLVNLFDVVSAAQQAGVRGTQTAYCQVQAIGVFDGCEYAVPGSANTDPANPGRQYWPANTQTADGLAATAYVIVDPQVVFSVQVGCGLGVNAAAPASVNAIRAGTAVATNAVAGESVQPGYFASVCYVANAGIVQGNTQTGQSYAFLDVTGAGVTKLAGSVLNLFIDSLSGNSENVPGKNYNNVEVVIANHLLRQIVASVVAAPVA